MKIAAVIERFEPMGGGVSRSTIQIAEELIRRGHHVTVLCGDSPPEFQLEGGIIRRAGLVNYKHQVKSAAFARWAREQISQGEFDTSLSVSTDVPAAVVQPRMGTYKERSDRGAQVAGGRRLRDCLKIGARLKDRTSLRRERNTLADPIVKQVVAISGYVADQLRRHYGINEDRITVLSNASVMPQLNSQQKQEHRKQIRDAFDIPMDAVVFLFAAHNPRLKGIEPLLRSICQLDDEGKMKVRSDASNGSNSGSKSAKPIVVLLAGRYGFADSKLAADLDVRGHIRVVGPTNQMQGLFCAADVTVLPTFYDAANKVGIESLIMGVPVITTGFNGAADLLFETDKVGVQQVRGRLIADPSDVSSLSRAMEDLSDDEERSKCASATAGLAEQLSMARHVEKLEKVLEKAAR
jgi:UDP-glucose:(heptosyl)LPS alpha-1,3-glucosyltransferase